MTSSITTSYLYCSTVEMVMYFIAYILFYLELHTSQICDHKSCKETKKLSKDYITDSLCQCSCLVITPTQKNRQQCLTSVNKLSPIANKGGGQEHTLLLNLTVVRRFPRCGYQNYAVFQGESLQVQSFFTSRNSNPRLFRIKSARTNPADIRYDSFDGESAPATGPQTA